MAENEEVRRLQGQVAYEAAARLKAETEVEEAVNDAKLLRNELAEARQEIENLRTSESREAQKRITAEAHLDQCRQDRDRLASEVTQLDQRLRMQSSDALVQTENDALKQCNYELRCQLIAAISRMPSLDDIYEVLAVTGGDDGG